MSSYSDGGYDDYGDYGDYGDYNDYNDYNDTGSGGYPEGEEYGGGGDQFENQEEAEEVLEEQEADEGNLVDQEEVLEEEETDERDLVGQEEVVDGPEETDEGESDDEWDAGSEGQTDPDGRDMTDQVEVTGELEIEWDATSERNTDSDEQEEVETEDGTAEWWDTDDEEVFGGGFYVPPLYSAQASYSTISRPVQPVSAAGTPGSAQVESMINLKAGEFMKLILGSKPTYKALLRTTGDQAQALLDVMQKLADDPNTPNDLRTKILRAIIRLCTTSGLYPRCLVLQDVQHGTECEAFGAFGDILLGSYKGHEICLKVARTYRKPNVGDLFKIYAREAIIWSQVFHPNLLPFYGIYHIQGGRLGLVSPWMRNGNVRDYLQANPEVPRRPMINEALAGLIHLHTLKIVHGDIKGVNILILPNGSACLADFGLSSLLDTSNTDWTSMQTTSMATGTLRWSAPELLGDDIEGDDSPRPTFASDVYSMAATMYEILTDKLPFYEFRLTAPVVKKVIEGSRPTKPPAEPKLELSDGVWDVMCSCWSKKPSERPTVGTVAERLHEIAHNEVTIRRIVQFQKTQDNNEIHPFTSQDFREAIRGGESSNSVVELDLLEELSLKRDELAGSGC